MALIRLNRVTVSNRPVPGFLPDFLTTGLYRVVDYVKIVGNLAVRRPTQDKSQGLQFSRRQAVNGGIYFTFAGLIISGGLILDVWKQPYTPQAGPSLVELRADPFERAMHESIGYGGWATSRMFSISAAAVITQNFLSTFLGFPPRQEPGSFSMDAIIKKLEAESADGR